MDLKASHALPLLLRAAGLARSTFFYRQAALKTPDPHAALRASIHKIFTAARGRYGYRRIHAADALRMKRLCGCGLGMEDPVPPGQSQRVSGSRQHHVRNLIDHQHLEVAGVVGGMAPDAEQQAV